MGVVSIRLSQDIEQFLQDRQLSPGLFGRELIEREVKRIRLQEARRRLEENRVRPKTPSLRALKEERRAH